MGYLKGKSTIIIFDRHANLKYKYRNRALLSNRVIYVSTVGLDEKMIAKYIQVQDLGCI